MRIWLFDASKQAIGAGVAHIANVTIAIALVGFSEENSTDECAMYFINFTLDTSIGVILNWLFLRLLVLLARRFKWTALQTPGDYGDPIRVRYFTLTSPSNSFNSSVWIIQLLAWLIIIVSAKLVIGRCIILFQHSLIEFAHWMFQPLEQHPRVELVLVMVACPCLMNALQFWVQDSFLKRKPKYDLLPRTDKWFEDDTSESSLQVSLHKAT
ncbi:hypothetical protein AC1031_001626 [Aphanomyces cochlioides]|nr:hypothetical protein AC1031_001626 [Aphanomyces cochlioides]